VNSGVDITERKKISEFLLRSAAARLDDPSPTSRTDEGGHFLRVVRVHAALKFPREHASDCPHCNRDPRHRSEVFECCDLLDFVVHAALAEFSLLPLSLASEPSLKNVSVDVSDLCQQPWDHEVSRRRVVAGYALEEVVCSAVS